MAKSDKEKDLEKELELGLKGSFVEFTNRKSIDRPTMVRVLEDVFRTLIRKKYGSDDNFDVIVDSVTGTLEIWRKREIVPEGEVEDERYQIDIFEAKEIEARQLEAEAEARRLKGEALKTKGKSKKAKEEAALEDIEPKQIKGKSEDEYKVGEKYYEHVDIISFGRRAIMAARQTLMSRVMELEKDKVYKIYSEKIGALIIGEVSQVLKKELVITDDATGAELMLPRTEMIRNDYYRKGDIVKAVVKKVELKNNSPIVILSRIDETFLERLLEQEVPEIEEGLVIVRKIVRAPGERAKVAVEAYDDNDQNYNSKHKKMDPVGACVGLKGSRIHGISRELRNENIDVINFTNNQELYIQRALTPAKVSNIEVNYEKRRAAVYLAGEEVSKAIGKRGINITLASRLTNYTIDVYREGYENEDYDVELDEFRDEIEGWIIDALKAVGCDSARSVLELSAEELARRTDLEEETILFVMQVLHSEFED